MYSLVSCNRVDNIDSDCIVVKIALSKYLCMSICTPTKMSVKKFYIMAFDVRHATCLFINNIFESGQMVHWKELYLFYTTIVFPKIHTYLPFHCLQEVKV